MRIVKLVPGDEVQFISDSKLMIGTIIKIFDDITDPVIIVKHENSVYKVSPSDVIPYTPHEDEPKAEERIEKESITISCNEFRSIASSVVADMASELGEPSLILIGATILSKLHRALFMEKRDND